MNYTTEYLEGVLTGLRICKEMWAQGTISHENIYENEIYYSELIKEEEKDTAYELIYFNGVNGDDLNVTIDTDKNRIEEYIKSLPPSYDIRIIKTKVRQ